MPLTKGPLQRARYKGLAIKTRYKNPFKEDPLWPLATETRSIKEGCQRYCLFKECY